MLCFAYFTLVGIGRRTTNLELLLSRQIVARGLLDVLREFSDNENDFISVMETIARMSEDGGRCFFFFFLVFVFLFFSCFVLVIECVRYCLIRAHRAIGADGTSS